MKIKLQNNKGECIYKWQFGIVRYDVIHRETEPLGRVVGIMFFKSVVKVYLDTSRKEE